MLKLISAILFVALIPTAHSFGFIGWAIWVLLIIGQLKAIENCTETKQMPLTRKYRGNDNSLDT